MIHLDTNFLVRGLLPATDEQRSWDRWVAAGEVVRVSAQAWAEFMCGPVHPTEVRSARRILEAPLDVGGMDAELAAELFNLGGRRRGSLGDCVIAAVAIRRDAELATANTDDFARFAPRGLRLRTP